jgi:hypothetical protein
VNNFLGVKENDEQFPSLFFRISVNLGMQLKYSSSVHVFLREHLPNHCQGLCSIFSEICTKFDAVP